MLIGVIGVNFKSAPLEIREELAKACMYAFGEQTFFSRIKNTVLLSTCNRTEIYFSAPDLAEMQTTIMGILREYVKKPFEHTLYSFFGRDCFLHLCKVTAGLDSAILAETEIQQQVRSAYTISSSNEKLSYPLHFLFQKTLQITKAARSRFPLPRGIPSLESVLEELIEQNPSALEGKKILLIGNSQVNKQIIASFSKKPHFDLTLCSKSCAIFHEPVKHRPIRVVGREALATLSNWDTIICASKSPSYILKEQALVLPKTLLLIDLSIPRLIHPLLGKNPMIHLLNMEQIGSLVDEKRRHHMQETGALHVLLHDAAHRSFIAFQEKMTHRPLSTRLPA